jgi:hypothetical protein
MKLVAQPTTESVAVPPEGARCASCLRRLGVFWCVLGGRFFHPKCAGALA